MRLPPPPGAVIREGRHGATGVVLGAGVDWVRVRVGEGRQVWHWCTTADSHPHCPECGALVGSPVHRYDACPGWTTEYGPYV